MSESCLIVVDDGRCGVILYKHWDGNPVMVTLLLREFAEWYAVRVAGFRGYFPHFLHKAEDVAAALISHDFLRKFDSRPSPDVRPTSLRKEEALSSENCVGEDYVYHVVLGENLTWKVKVYRKKRGLEHLEDHEIDLKAFLPPERLEALKKLRAIESLLS